MMITLLSPSLPPARAIHRHEARRQIRDLNDPNKPFAVSGITVRNFQLARLKARQEADRPAYENPHLTDGQVVIAALLYVAHEVDQDGECSVNSDR